MEEFMNEYQNKFKLITLLTLLDLNTADKRKQFVKDFKLNLFNKTNEELRTMVIKNIDEIVKNYKHIAPYRM